MRSWLFAALLAAACSLCLSAANYYERIDPASDIYDDLRVLSAAGYLGGWAQPEYSMLRLEVAMLLQAGLPDYHAAEAAGRTDKHSDEAARRLAKEFKEELKGIGGLKPAAAEPAAAAPKPQAAEPSPTEPLAAGSAADTELLIIEDEVLSDGLSAVPPGAEDSASGAQRADAGSTTISLDTLAEQQQSGSAELRPIPLPDGLNERSQGHDPTQFVAADEPSRTAPPAGEAAWTPSPSVAEAAAPPLRLDPPTSVPAATPRPYRASAGDGRDMNLLLDQREREQGAVALNVEGASPGPLAQQAVADSRLGPPQRYRRQIDLEVKPFIDAQGQFAYRNTDGTAVSGTASDIRLYWADAGLDFMHEDWQARVALNFNDRSSEPKLHELWAEFRDSESGLYGRAGRSPLPFATRKGWFPTFGYARELGFTTANTVGAGWNKPEWGASVWVYDAPVENVGGGSSSLDELAFNLQAMSDSADDSDSSWRLALAYVSELGGHERGLAAGPLAASVPGLSLSGSYSWDCGVWQVALDYAGALEGYSAGALDANGDGLGDQPTALGLELIYSPAGLAFYGLRFEATSQYAGAAGTRWGLLYGQWLSEQMLGRLELSRGTYNGYTPGKSRDIALTADLNLVF